MNEILVGNVTLGQFIAWIILGLLVGSFVGWIFKNRKRGYGMVGNLVIGLVGAIIGGIVFDWLGIDFGRDVALSLNDFLSAFIGAVIFIGLVVLVRR